MTYRDAATLLMATCGSLNPLGATKAVERLRALRPAPADKLAKMQARYRADLFGWLKKPLSFHETLEGLIERAPALSEWGANYVQRSEDLTEQTDAAFSIRRAQERISRSGSPFQPGLIKPVRVVFYGPGVAAEVHLGWLWNDLIEEDAFHEYYINADRSKLEPEQGGALFDVMIPVEVGLATLLSLHNAVNAKPRTRGPSKGTRGSG
jgi:hypothetical protein